ncbi:hypothetical protein ELQ35_13810 [Peribacillus cavernae]|uniref:Uncharacterized protein n=1 Tax=Peribacillus cavernae TaxID=1674310 RepID=A0A3S0TU50_9BACI|nr:hypothetical protein [Peribacillus cavernae]MDQ0220520.1 hypothetical protein [Peribacillus cavernae]RUQ27989.1 hypothetical protein ELQ35_13810 [Peribacillus cavernae]
MQYLCIKDWELNGTVYFKKDKSYKGREVKLVVDRQINSIKMIGENNLRIKFQKDNEYFSIT